jgi:hypothetical protein
LFCSGTIRARVAIPTKETIKVIPAAIRAMSTFLTPKKTKTPTNAAATADRVKNVEAVSFLGMIQA